MVQAILEGRKTVTRRVINRDIVNYCDMEADGTLLNYHNCYGDVIDPVKLCRYKVNDVLYVRETYMEAGCKLCEVHECYGSVDCAKYWYKADMSEYDLDEMKEEKLKWRPSIHMPREAARIFLRVKSVRVERLQDMTREDMLKEGIIDYCGNCKAPFGCDLCSNESAVEDNFFHLWNGTLKKDQLKYYGWYANPYVWVIEFERMSKEAAVQEVYSNGDTK